MSKESIDQLIEAEVQNRVAQRLIAQRLKSQPAATNTDGMQYVIVRTYGAGVHAGYLQTQCERTVVLRQSRRCRKFVTGAIGDCTDLAIVGVKSGSTIRPPLDTHTLLDAIEVIPATESARKSIEEYPE